MADLSLCPTPAPLKNEVKLPWGLDLENNLVHVSLAENGRASKLSCPNCSGALDAKQGRQLRWHFAHVSTAWCSGGVESLAHRRAIEILLEKKKVFLPPPDELSEGFWGSFSRAMDEVPLALENPRRVDLMLYAGNSRLAVEICVAHPVDEKKEADLSKWPYPSIEIFVDPEVALATTEDDFINHVLRWAPRRWISQAGWFAGTEEGVEAQLAREKEKSAAIFRAKAYARLGPTPFRISFLHGLSLIRETNPSFYAEFVTKLRSGKGGPKHYHHFMLRCGELGYLLGFSANKVGALVKKLGLEYRPPWGFIFIGGFYCTSKLSPQGVIAVWAFAHKNKLTSTSCTQLIEFIQTQLR